ncbi:MAG: SIS domain-containing protein [Desulfobacterales bacterium]|nr:SIS domain-containing protein [Desulfobacterales bacterium]
MDNSTSPDTHLSLLKRAGRSARSLLNTTIHLGKRPKTSLGRALILFPIHPTTLCCGLAGMVSFENALVPQETLDLVEALDRIEKKGLSSFLPQKNDLDQKYLGGPEAMEALYQSVCTFKQDTPFASLITQSQALDAIQKAGVKAKAILTSEEALFQEKAGTLSAPETQTVVWALEKLKDIYWTLSLEILENVTRTTALSGGLLTGDTWIRPYKKINATLNAINRLEVRGRDSAGISVMLTFTPETWQAIETHLVQEGLETQLGERLKGDTLLNNSLAIGKGPFGTSLAFVYKRAAEIGSLGDNVSFLRQQVRNDLILRAVTTFPHTNLTVNSHTRWASVGAITDANCHPVDNRSTDSRLPRNGTLHVSLNGDIDNHLQLKGAWEDRYAPFQKEITTDTKVIPMQIETYLKAGHDIEEAFRLSVCDFKGSHAITLQTDLAPGKLFLAQKGSGQALFVGLAPDHYIAVSEVYGFVEETSRYLKLDGEKTITGKDGKPVSGQIMILDAAQAAEKGAEAGITSYHYDGTPIDINAESVMKTEITSRDIDRQDFPHYFLKEISESPDSVEKTLTNRWKRDEAKDLCYTCLDEDAIPASIISGIRAGRISRIFLVGQGTAGIAAQAIGHLFTHYLGDPSIQVCPLKASELSGFMMGDEEGDTMSDALVIAISQSGTTTDTNLAVDMVKRKGAATLAIVNRRDSDLTFKVDGVVYTSSGRDIEMSVASTKAFYSQIVAGALIGLHLSAKTEKQSSRFISQEIRELLALPPKMRKVLTMKEGFKESAFAYAVNRTYWASVGSGANKASSDEIRIKLSELCYKTISSDFVEDKKHIDLSSEPLILVCAAGTRESVLGDIIKDTAIFNAHKAIPIVITDEGEERFTPYARSIFQVPRCPEHLAPIVNTLAGHIWGYYAALAINEGSRLIFSLRKKVQKLITEYEAKGMNLYEITLEKRFRETITEVYRSFRSSRRKGMLPPILGLNTASDITLVLKYLNGKLPSGDFELDFGVKGIPRNMLNKLFECFSDAINAMARPVDAIKHQAKTVTVGTSRITETFEGILFDELTARQIALAQLTSTNVLVLKNLQGVIEGIKGAVFYRIDGLNLLGEATEKTTISLLEKSGVFQNIESRVENDTRLKGTKSIIVREGNVFIGKGNKDDKNTLIIPILSKEANFIEHILSLNVTFKKGRIPLHIKSKALGGKHERIRNIMQERGFTWDDAFMDLLPVDQLFGLSAEKIGEAMAQAIEM